MTERERPAIGPDSRPVTSLIDIRRRWHKRWLAGAAILGVVSGYQIGHAVAQAPNPAMGPTVGAGMMQVPTALPLASAQETNNAYGRPDTYHGGARFPAATVPLPGTVVIRLNGKVTADMDAFWSSANRFTTADGKTYKVNPVGFNAQMRLYPAVDGMAANGLRYGAAIELRQDTMSSNNYAFTGATSAPGATGYTPGGNTVGTTAASPGGATSGQTIYVRRAFVYLAADGVGIVRFGQTDGVIGMFDPGIFSSQTWAAGIDKFNTGLLQSRPPAWLAQEAGEGGNTKIVYLSPQFLGVDFGLQYAPGMANGFGNGAGVSPLQAAPCNAAGASIAAVPGVNSSTSGCPGASTGADPTRWLNQVAVGARWQEHVGQFDLGVFAVYETAGKESYNGSYTTKISATSNPLTLRYDNLSFVQVAGYVTLNIPNGRLTYAVDYIGGRLEAPLAMTTSGGAPERAVLTSLTYREGRLTLGAELGIINSQGSAVLTGISQRRVVSAAFGGNYNLAPGLYLMGAWLFVQRHQGGFDFLSGAAGVGTHNTVHGQGLLLSTVVNW